MKNVLIVFVALVGVSFFAQTASADSVESSVSISVYWTCGSIYSLHSPGYDPCASDAQVIGEFSSFFDVYADGSLVPGTMDFAESGTSQGLNGSYQYAGAPLTYSGPGFGLPVTIDAPFSWNTSGTDTISFLPPGCTYLGTPAVTCTTWPPLGNATYGASTIVLNCFDSFAGECDGHWQCQSIECAWGGDQPATGGAVNITQFVVTPEPPTVSLLGIGLLGLFVLGRMYAERERHAIETGREPDRLFTD